MSLTKPLAIGVLSLIGCSLASMACAQSINTSSASFQRGYGLVRNQLQSGVNPSTRDANGNRVLLDGSLLTGSDNSVFSASQSFGAGDSFSGAGAVGGATAIGNNLQVIVTGNYNTVVVNATQTNNGTVTATTGTDTTSLNGQVNLNGSN
jgi:holdfast attachment protein HfaA